MAFIAGKLVETKVAKKFWRFGADAETGSDESTGNCEIKWKTREFNLQHRIFIRLLIKSWINFICGYHGSLVFVRFGGDMVTFPHWVITSLCLLWFLKLFRFDVFRLLAFRTFGVVMGWVYRTAIETDPVFCCIFICEKGWFHNFNQAILWIRVNLIEILLSLQIPGNYFAI